MNRSNYLPSVSIDCVILGFHDNELRVLLLKIKNLETWALPGGFVEVDQDLDLAAIAVLKKRTGLENIFLKQFKVFGAADRSQVETVDKMVKDGILDEASRPWFAQRFISVGYYALVEYSKVIKPQPDYTSERCEWVPINDLPPMIIDHAEIIQKAHITLKKELNYQPIGLNLLPEEFTIPELQALYETILMRKLDRRNFRRKILTYGILIDTGQRRMGAQNRAPIIYKFDEEEYQKVLIRELENGMF